MPRHSANLAALIIRRVSSVLVESCRVPALSCSSRASVPPPPRSHILGDAGGGATSMFRARRCSSHPRLVSGTLNNGICFGGFSKGESRRCFSGDRLPVGHLALDPKELIPDTTGLYSASALSSKERRLKEERRLNEERWLNEERRTNEVKKAQAQPKTVTLPLLTFDALREDVLNRVFNKDEHIGRPFFSPSLTSILGGFRQGELTIYTGRTGVGKTTYLSQLSLDLAVNQGIDTLWGSFEIPNVRLVTTMLQQRAGFAMMSTKDMSEEDRLKLTADFDKKFSLMPRNMYFLSYYGAIDCDTIIQQISHEIDTRGIKHVILDNLQFMTSLDASYSEVYARQDYICHRLRMLATEANIHVSLVIHPRKVDITKTAQPADLLIESVGGSPKSTQEADNIIMIQRDKDSHQRVVDVQKNRFSGNLGRVTLRFDRGRMLYQEPGLDFDIFSAVDSKAEGGSAEGAAQEPETDEQRNERWRLSFKALLVDGQTSIPVERMGTFVQGYEAEKLMGTGQGVGVFESWRLSPQGAAADAISESHFMDIMKLLDQRASAALAGGDVAAALSVNDVASNAEDVDPAAGKER